MPADDLAQGDAPAGTVVDPETGNLIDAETGQVLDPVTGEPLATAAGTSGAAGTTGPAAPGSSAGGAAQTRSGSGPAAGSGSQGPAVPPATSTLFTPAEDRIGITDKQITLCAHAALTFGAAFNTSAEDLNVHWDELNSKGGIFGRKVVATYENDDYKPETAVQAATACKQKNPFILLGGIGFDQIPAVRNYVERERMLYIHHTATVNGSKGLKHSWTLLPTVERTGQAFAQLAAKKYRGKKFGIIERDSANWKPGTDAFRAAAKRLGLQVVASRKVASGQANYVDEVLEMRNKGAEVVFAWENALASTEIITQAKAQAYSPYWLLFPFNLTSQTLAEDAMNPPLDGVAMFAAYSKGDRGGPFKAYADDIEQFEREYAKWRPNVDLAGVGGDLLFLNWQAQKALAAMFTDCGKDCTRNRFVDVLTNYKKRPTSSACPIDLTQGDRRHGSDMVNFMETYRAPGNKINWRHTQMCVAP